MINITKEEIRDKMFFINEEDSDQPIAVIKVSDLMEYDDMKCMNEDAKQASIPYTYNAPQHDWKCGYPSITRGEEK